MHEAYLRLVGPDESQRWANRAHFFAAAAEAMRRILVEEARRKQSQKRGGPLDRHDLEEAQLAAPDGVDVLELDEALDRLAARDEEAARLVKLRFFAGMTMPEAAQALNLSERTAERVWAYARSFLRVEIGAGEQSTRSAESGVRILAVSGDGIRIGFWKRSNWPTRESFVAMKERDIFLAALGSPAATSATRSWTEACCEPGQKERLQAPARSGGEARHIPRVAGPVDGAVGSR